MRVYLSPAESDKQQIIKFNKEIIQITVDNTVYEYDFSNLKDGKMANTSDHIISAKRENGELSVKVVKFINLKSTELEQFPQWQTINGNDDLDAKAKIVKIEWYSEEQKEFDELLSSLDPTSEELADAELEIKVLTLLMDMGVI